MATLVIRIADYHGKCPNCLDLLLAAEEEDDNYKIYRKNAEERFGDYNLPLCYYCWSENAEGCDTCFLPMKDVVFGRGLGNVIMRSTTVVAGEKAHICDYCRE